MKTLDQVNVGEENVDFCPMCDSSSHEVAEEDEDEIGGRFICFCCGHIYDEA